MTNKPLLWVGGAGAVGACLLAGSLGAGSPLSGDVETGGAPVLVAVSAPAPVAPGTGSSLPPATLRNPEPAAAVPSVRGGAPAGQAGVWSKPAEFAPPE